MRLEESIIHGLSEIGRVPDYLKRLVDGGVIATVDTQMIIDEDEFHPVEQGKLLSEDALVPFTPIEESIEEIQRTIADEGLVKGHFHTLVRGFGSLLFGMIASPAQLAEVTAWHESGLAQFGGFLMADGGGSSIQEWKTVFVKHEEMLELEVNKVWIIEGHRLDYGSIVSASSQRLFPQSILVPPEQFAQLTKTPVGDPFLEGTLQLGNVRGKVSVPKSCMLTLGGLASTSIFLCKIRPRFVRALMAHMLWLGSSGQVTMTAAQRDSIEALGMIAWAHYRDLVKRKPSLPMALALKFASNQILLDLVATGSARILAVRRDLMAFTRMEGSSYRCLFEIYGRLKVR